MPPLKVFESEARFATTKQHEKAISKMMKSAGFARRSDATRTIFEAGMRALYDNSNNSNNTGNKNVLQIGQNTGTISLSDRANSQPQTRSKR